MTAWKSAAGLKTEGRPLANPVVREEGDDRAREKPFRAAPQLWGACCLAGRHLRAPAFLPWGNGDPPRFHYSTKSEWSLCSNQKIRTARARSIGATLWICQRPQHAPYEFPIIRCPTGRAEQSIIILCRQELFLSCASIRFQQTGNKNHAGKQVFVIRSPPRHPPDFASRSGAAFPGEMDERERPRQGRWNWDYRPITRCTSARAPSQAIRSLIPSA